MRDPRRLLAQQFYCSKKNWVLQQFGSRNGTFNSVRREAIKQGLSNILGVSGAASVIINFNLDAYEDDAPSFHNSLHNVFKVPGTEVLEKSIIKEMYGLMGEHFDSSGTFDFATQMNFAKKLYNAKATQ